MTADRVDKDLRDAMKSAAEPVRRDAEQLAVSNIRRIGIPWSRMRTGVTRHSVYVAPVERGVKSRTIRRGRRPNLKPLLLERAMDPALDQNADKVEREVIDAMDDLFRRWERV